MKRRMNSVLLIAIIAAVVMLLMAPLCIMSCSSDSPTEPPPPPPYNPFACRDWAPSGIDPPVGTFEMDISSFYTFDVVEEGGRKRLDVSWDSAVEGGRYGTYPTHGSEFVEDGVWQWQWGNRSGGTHCPTDGFCFSGHFTSETRANGTLQTMRDCQVMNEYEWIANFVE